MGSKNYDGQQKPDGIERISNAVMVGIVGIVLVCAMLPVIISQIAGLGSNAALASWSGLASFQAIAYVLPVIFIIGLIIVTIRFFSNSRE